MIDKNIIGVLEKRIKKHKFTKDAISVVEVVVDIYKLYGGNVMNKLYFFANTSAAFVFENEKKEALKLYEEFSGL